MSTLKVIITNYPKSLTLITKINFFHNSFLNLRMYNLPNIYKEAGIRSAVLTNLRNSNRVLEKKYGSELNRFILNKRGHNLTKMIKMEKNIKNKEYKKKKEGKIEKHSDEKRYLSSVTFDKRSKIHSIIRNITNNCGLPDYVKKTYCYRG